MVDYLPSLETLTKAGEFVERFGYVPVALAGTWYLVVRCGRGVVKGFCYVWTRIEEPIVGILSSHKDLMETAKDQIPKQTAILEGLAVGQRESSALLASLDSHVRKFVPLPQTGDL